MKKSLLFTNKLAGADVRTGIDALRTLTRTARCGARLPCYLMGLRLLFLLRLCFIFALFWHPSGPGPDLMAHLCPHAREIPRQRITVRSLCRRHLSMNTGYARTHIRLWYASLSGQDDHPPAQSIASNSLLSGTERHQTAPQGYPMSTGPPSLSSVTSMWEPACCFGFKSAYALTRQRASPLRQVCSTRINILATRGVRERTALKV